MVQEEQMWISSILPHPSCYPDIPLILSSPSPSTHLWHTYTHMDTLCVLLLPSSLSHLILSPWGFKRTSAQQWPVTCHSGCHPSHRHNIYLCNTSKQPITFFWCIFSCLCLLHAFFESHLSIPCYLLHQKWSPLNDKHPLDNRRTAVTLGIMLLILLIKLERDESTASSFETYVGLV